MRNLRLPRVELFLQLKRILLILQLFLLTLSKKKQQRFQQRWFFYHNSTMRRVIIMGNRFSPGRTTIGNPTVTVTWRRLNLSGFRDTSVVSLPLPQEVGQTRFVFFLLTFCFCHTRTLGRATLNIPTQELLNFIQTKVRETPTAAVSIDMGRPTSFKIILKNRNMSLLLSLWHKPSFKKPPTETNLTLVLIWEETKRSPTIWLAQTFKRPDTTNSLTFD